MSIFSVLATVANVSGVQNVNDRLVWTGKDGYVKSVAAKANSAWFYDVNSRSELPSMNTVQTEGELVTFLKANKPMSLTEEETMYWDMITDTDFHANCAAFAK